MQKKNSFANGKILDLLLLKIFNGFKPASSSNVQLVSHGSYFLKFQIPSPQFGISDKSSLLPIRASEGTLNFVCPACKATNINICGQVGFPLKMGYDQKFSIRVRSIFCCSGWFGSVIFGLGLEIFS